MNEHPEGQLCPYDDCCHDLAIPSPGWYTCGACKRSFYARVSESDYEDYVCYQEHEHKGKPSSGKLPVAEDLGPSWGTPKESNV